MDSYDPMSRMPVLPGWVDAVQQVLVVAAVVAVVAIVILLLVSKRLPCPDCHDSGLAVLLGQAEVPGATLPSVTCPCRIRTASDRPIAAEPRPLSRWQRIVLGLGRALE